VASLLANSCLPCSSILKTEMTFSENPSAFTSCDPKHLNFHSNFSRNIRFNEYEYELKVYRLYLLVNTEILVEVWTRNLPSCVDNRNRKRKTMNEHCAMTAATAYSTRCWLSSTAGVQGCSTLANIRLPRR
jgi:hypothetical protein